MIKPITINILKELIKELELENWIINLTKVEPRSICQFNKGKFNFIFDDKWAITYCLPMSKIAEIYLLPNKENIKKLLRHELLHVKLSPFIYMKMTEIELTVQDKEEARKKHLELRRMEHRMIDKIEKKIEGGEING